MKQNRMQRAGKADKPEATKIPGKQTGKPAQKPGSGKHRKLVPPGAIQSMVILLVSIPFLELILRLNQSDPFWNTGLIVTVLFSLSVAMLLSSVSFFLRGMAARICVMLLLLIASLLYASQFVYFQVFETYYTLYSAGRGTQVLEFLDVILGTIASNWGWIMLMLLPLPVYLLVLLKSRTRPGRSWRFGLIGLALALALFVSGIIVIHWGPHDPNTPYHSYYIDRYPNSSVRQLGLFTTMRLDLQTGLLDQGVSAGPLPPPISTSTMPTTGNPNETKPEKPMPTGMPSPTPTPIPVDQVMPIDFEQLIAQAQSDELIQMHTYFQQTEPSRQNDHTGMFQGYNLILVTAEGYSHYAVDEEITPTLYKMTHDGFHFTNFYNPIWGVSTLDGEYVATTGLIPKTGVWSLYHSGKNIMPFAMGNQLGKLGYRTMAYHNHTYDYYRRDISHPNLGYDYKGVGNGLNVTPTWPASDLEMMQLTVDEYIDQEPFHAYYMTVSGHLQYNFTGNFIARKNQDWVADLPYTEPAKAYLATQIELDRAMEYLLEQLEQAGVAERTLIVISADHYPYGLEDVDLDNLAGHEVERNFELYRSSLIMYVPGMTPELIEKPVSSMDIIPTVSNLLGLEFDSRLLMGRDAFSDSDPMVIFLNRSFITDQGRFNSLTKTWDPAAGSTVGEEYLQAVTDEIERRFYYSARILDFDYYAMLGLG